MTLENQRANIEVACDRLALVAQAHDLVISHGNGPQIGLLALEAAAYTPVPPYPLDVLVAETQGMIGYLIEQELRNRLPADRAMATVLTMIEVDPADPALHDPSKPIGPLYSKQEADELASERGWAFKPDGDHHRRVVPSPAPRRIIELHEIRLLLDAGAVVICAGGGGVPTALHPDHQLVGVEGVIDKDRASALLALDVDADALVMATDAAAAYLDYGGPDQRAITEANPDELLAAHREEFAAGSMLPKVEAAADFARRSGKPAAIGQLADIEGLVSGGAGTRISTEVDGVLTDEQMSSRDAPGA
jgi:carbamate kinase